MHDEPMHTPYESDQPWTQPLRPDEVLTNGAFVRQRARLQPLVSELRRSRRHRIGPQCTIAFENRETVLWQIQEVLRIEGRAGRRHVEAELTRYEALMPRPGELRATVFVDGGPPESAEWLCERLGRDRGTLELRVGETTCPAECVDEHPSISSPVRYMRFDLGRKGIRETHLATRRAELVLRDSFVRVETLPHAMRTALATDLRVAG